MHDDGVLVVDAGNFNTWTQRYFMFRYERRMSGTMAGAMGMPFARRSSKKNAKNKKGKKGRGPTQAKARNPLFDGQMPADFPDLSQLPEGLNQLPPGLAGFDLSKLKFPGKN
jgi:signal recognition particle subunit SRP54